MNAPGPEDFDTSKALEDAWARFIDMRNTWWGDYTYSWEECGWLNGKYYTTSAEKVAIERSLLGPPQDQPTQPATPGEDPTVELQRSFFEIPGFMQPPQRGGS